MQGFTYIAPSVMEEMTKPWLSAREPRSPRKIGLPSQFMRLVYHQRCCTVMLHVWLTVANTLEVYKFVLRSVAL